MADALTGTATNTNGEAAASEQQYRERIRWDKVTWATHCVDCYPGNCPYRVYVKDGVVVAEEQAANLPVVEQGVPDMNPLGCQKGAAWSRLLYAPERVLHPLKRAGERGGGKWQQVTWDQALTEIADHMLDALETGGPETIINEGTPGEGGLLTGAGEFGSIRALTFVVVYEITQEGQAPLMRDRPAIADELGSLLSKRSAAELSKFQQLHGTVSAKSVPRFTARIRNLFNL